MGTDVQLLVKAVEVIKLRMVKIFANPLNFIGKIAVRICLEY